MAVESRESPATATFASLLRQHRIAAALSQEALAERAGLSVRAISDLERGVKTRPYLETVRMLADALDLSPADRAELAMVARQPVTTSSGRIPVPDAGTRTALPTTLTSLFGRDADIAAVSELLLRDGIRMVTLTGPGGVGKTSLAIKVANQVNRRFSDGALFVNLAPIREPNSVVYSILQALDTQETPDKSPLDQLADAIDGRSLLLVLDNFEHVVSAAPIIASLIGNCPGLQVLVTSRAPLHIRAEREYQVRPLALPALGDAIDPAVLEQSPAIALFVERCQAISQDFRLDSGNTSAVTQICKRLDGLPLAIELVAAWSKILTPQAILSRMERRTLCVSRGAKDLPDRQQTLERCIEWSYDLLSPEAQALFRQLSVFDGGCSLEAAEAVCESSESIVDNLYTLIDSSLVHHSSFEKVAPRYLMLQTIREFALAKFLTHEEMATRRSAHGDFFLDMAEEAEQHLTGQDQSSWMDRLELEHDNLRAALTWFGEPGDADRSTRLAGSLWQFWYTRGYLSEGRKWLETAVASPGGSDFAARAKALSGAGVLIQYLGDHAFARSLHDQAGAYYRDLNDQRSLAFSLICLGSIDMREGNAASATGYFDEALSLHRELRNERGIALALSWLAEAAAYEGLTEKAADLLDETLALSRRLDDPYYLGAALANRGEVHQLCGQLEEATVLLSDALEISRSLGEKRMTSASLTNLGRNAMLLGDLDCARTRLLESVAISRDVGDKSLIANAIDQLAALAVRQNELELAVCLYAGTDAMRNAIAAPRAPWYQEFKGKMLEAARIGLGKPSFDSAWVLGGDWDLETLVARAMGHQPFDRTTLHP